MICIFSLETLLYTLYKLIIQNTVIYETIDIPNSITSTCISLIFVLSFYYVLKLNVMVILSRPITKVDAQSFHLKFWAACFGNTYSQAAVGFDSFFFSPILFLCFISYPSQSKVVFQEAVLLRNTCREQYFRCEKGEDKIKR